MTIRERFDAALATMVSELPDLEMLPVRLAKTCVAVLPVAGAGISALAHPELRLPIGSSDETAAYVERLQFTYAEGPCLAAYASGRPQLASAGVIARFWPELHRDLTAVTPFRAVASLPLHDDAERIGALDLYLEQPGGLEFSDLTDAFAVADLVSDALVAARLYTAVAQRTDFDALPVAHRDPLAGRIQVWKAMGLINIELRLTTSDALAVLRAHAYANERLVDDLAHDVVSRRISIDSLRP